MSDDNNNSFGGGCFGLLCVGMFLIFLTLKLLGIISWSWWWICAPLWIPLAVGIIIILIVLIVLVWVSK